MDYTLPYGHKYRPRQLSDKADSSGPSRRDPRNCCGLAAVTHLQSLTTGRRAGRYIGLLTQVREYPFDHQLFQDRRNDLQLTATVRAVLQVEIEHALKQLGPTLP